MKKIVENFLERSGYGEAVFMNKPGNFLIYLFLFLLPWQTRLILRPGVLNGGNWEYGIVGIYGTEILLWIIILILLIQKSLPKPDNKKLMIGLIILAYFSFSILIAADKFIALQHLIHLIETAVVFLILILISFDSLKLAYIFLSGLVLQAILGVYQFLTQSAPVSRWLGLTAHEATTGGISVLENFSGRWLRAYAGFPHPNVFGGYMVIGILIAVILMSRFRLTVKARCFLLSVNCLLLVGLLFSFSRSAWLGLVIGLTVYGIGEIKYKTFLRANNFLIAISIILPLLVNLFLFGPLFLGRISGEGRLEVKAIAERAGGYIEAKQLFRKHPLFGVGLGNYTSAVRNELDPTRRAWKYQPVHNAILLLLIELGGIGVLFLIFSVLRGFSTMRHFETSILDFKFSIVFLIFFVLGLFDHYLWSLYSGLLLIGAGGGILTKLISRGRV